MSRLSTMALRSLGFADEAASTGDFVAALSWIQVVESVGYDLPDAYHAKRSHWQTQADAAQPARLTSPTGRGRSPLGPTAGESLG